MDNELILRAIAKERGVPYEQVVAEYGGLPSGGVTPAAIAAPAPVAPVATPQAEVVDPWAASPPPAPPPPVVMPPPAEATAPAPLTMAPSIQSAETDLAQLSQEDTSAYGRIAQAEAEAATRKAGLANDMAAGYARDVEQHAPQLKAAQADETRVRQELRAANDDIAALPPITARRDIGQKVWGALGILLSSAGDAMSVYGGGQSGGAQAAAALINQGIERELRVQQANLDGKQAKASARLTELGVARQYVQDAQQSLKLAMALRGERFAAEMEAQASTLQSKTARDRGVLEANKLRMAYRAEANDILQSALAAKAAAAQAVALGKMTPQQAADFVAGTSSSGSGAAPSSMVAGPMTASQKGAVNVTTYQNEIPGVDWLVDSSKVSKEDREAAQKIASAHDRVIAIVRMASDAYTRAADSRLPSQERLSALNRYRSLAETQLPGLVSQATGSGTPQEGEAKRMLNSLPPTPVVNDVGGIRGAVQAVENWRNDRSMDPRAFQYWVEDFSNSVNQGLRAYKARIAPETPQRAAPAPAPAPAPPRAPDERKPAGKPVRRQGRKI